MNESSNQARRFTKDGIAALHRGDYRVARERLQRAVANSEADASVWLGLALACGHLGDNEATLAAVDHALLLEPRNLRALIFKGDHLTRMKRTRKALACYQGAIKVAAQLTDLPADIRSGLRRAQTNCDSFSEEYENFLLDSLGKQGYRRGITSVRFDQSLDIAFGKRQVYYQQPTRFYFPGLPQIQFYEREMFPWLDEVEAATDAIRSELLAILQDKESFNPYLVDNPDSVKLNDTSNLNNEDWGAFYFFQEGQPVEDNLTRCPQSARTLDTAPLCKIPGSTPHALYSRLAGGAKIPPHVGLINTRLICHLPLLVPENCGALRCGNQVQEWIEGRAYVFDDTIEHEAWNDSDRERVVLLFDIWRPELIPEERELVTAMLQAVQSYESEDEI